MTTGQPKSLLVGAEFRSASAIIRLFRNWQCECTVVNTFRQACQSIESNGFAIVLSINQLPDGSGFGLIKRLRGLPVTMFVALPVQNSCLWLPALLHGEYCWGTQALRPRAFVRLLEEVIAMTHVRVPEEVPPALRLEVVED